MSDRCRFNYCDACEEVPGSCCEEVQSLRKELKEAKNHDLDIEVLSEAVHKAYCADYLKRKGRCYWTGGDYSKLDEETKEIDRATVRAVLAAIEAKEGG